MDIEINGFRIVCEVCSIWFVVSDKWRERRIKDKKVFYCPNGHENRYDRREKINEDANKNQTD